MHKILKNALSLLMSWDRDNIELLKTLISGDSVLSLELANYLRPFFDALPKRFLYPDRLELLASLFETSINIRRFKYHEGLKPLLESMPCERMIFGNQGLLEFPAWFCLLKKLKEISFAYSFIEELPTEINTLEQLEILDLQHNRIHTLPNSFSQLKHLKRLELSHNQLKTLPEDFGKLQQLEQISLDQNPIERLPSSILDLPNLIYLNIAGSPLAKKHASPQYLFKTEEDRNILKKLVHK